MGELVQRRRERGQAAGLAGREGLPILEEGRGEVRGLVQGVAGLRRVAGSLAETGTPLPGMGRRVGEQVSRGSRPPKAFERASASSQPPTAPATVTIASGPRGGIAS